MAGIAIIVANNINVSQQKYSSCDLLFQSIIINCGRELQITNISKECDINLNPQMVEQISLFSNAYYIILGYLNAQNSLWVSTGRQS